MVHCEPSTAGADVIKVMIRAYVSFSHRTGIVVDAQEMGALSVPQSTAFKSFLFTLLIPTNRSLVGFYHVH